MANPKKTKYGFPTSWRNAYALNTTAARLSGGIRATGLNCRPTNLSRAGWKSLGGSKYRVPNENDYVFMDWHAESGCGAWGVARWMFDAPRAATGESLTIAAFADDPGQIVVNSSAEYNPTTPSLAKYGWTSIGGNRWQLVADNRIINAVFNWQMFGRKGGWRLYHITDTRITAGTSAEEIEKIVKGE